MTITQGTWPLLNFLSRPFFLPGLEVWWMAGVSGIMTRTGRARSPGQLCTAGSCLVCIPSNTAVSATIQAVTPDGDEQDRG